MLILFINTTNSYVCDFVSGVVHENAISRRLKFLENILGNYLLTINGDNLF